MYLLSRGAAFGPLVKNFLLQGAYFQFERYAAYEDACRIRARLLAEIGAAAGKAGFLMFPSPDAAPASEPGTLDGFYSRFAGTLFANVAGLPALYLPPTQGAAGFQLAAPRLGGPDLIALGEYLYTARRGG
jgi:aspartyl-tRNA(Asn)/glutamyl-tRNA(Gln) amidotransferase subunit A